VIVGEDVVQPKVTVPLKPGIDVSTIPIANVPPGGTGGKVPPAGSVTEIEIGEFEIVSKVDPVTSFNVAEIVVVKAGVVPVEAKPAALIVAASVLEDDHVTVVVMFFVLLSEYVPVAVNCSDEPIGSVGFAGVTAIDFNVAAPAVNVAVTASATAGIVNVQVAPATVHIVGVPLHPANVEPLVTACVNTTCVPAAKLTMQPLADPLTQLIPLPITVPVPVPAVATVSRLPPVPLLNVTETVTSVVPRDTVHDGGLVCGLLGVQFELNAPTDEPCAGEAVSTTALLSVKGATQTVGQLMPLGWLVTVPLPLPFSVTVILFWPGAFSPKIARPDTIWEGAVKLVSWLPLAMSNL
jgi:hypothetical protein